VTNPIAKRLDRLEAHVAAKVDKGYLRFGNKTYSRCISIVVNEHEDEGQIIAQKRASGEITPDTFIIAHHIVSPPKRPPWTEPLRAAVPDSTPD